MSSLPDTRVRNFLLSWVLEFGTAYVSADELHDNAWWCEETLSLGRTPELSKYSDAYYDKENRQRVRINQAGLDFIKDGGDAEDEEKHQ